MTEQRQFIDRIATITVTGEYLNGIHSGARNFKIVDTHNTEYQLQNFNWRPIIHDSIDKTPGTNWFCDNFNGVKMEHINFDNTVIYDLTISLGKMQILIAAIGHNFDTLKSRFISDSKLTEILDFVRGKLQTIPNMAKYDDGDDGYRLPSDTVTSIADELREEINSIFDSSLKSSSGDNDANAPESSFFMTTRTTTEPISIDKISKVLYVVTYLGEDLWAATFYNLAADRILSIGLTSGDVRIGKISDSEWTRQAYYLAASAFVALEDND